MKSESEEIREMRDRRIYADYLRLLQAGNRKATIYRWLRYNYYISSDQTLRAIIKGQEQLTN